MLYGIPKKWTYDGKGLWLCSQFWDCKVNDLHRKHVFFQPQNWALKINIQIKNGGGCAYTDEGANQSETNPYTCAHRYIILKKCKKIEEGEKKEGMRGGKWRHESWCVLRITCEVGMEGGGCDPRLCLLLPVASLYSTVHRWYMSFERKHM